MRRICRVIFWAYVVFALGALALAEVGTRGLFGTQPDGLAAIWLIFAGLPWTLAGAPMALAGWPDALGLLLIYAAPVLNAALVRAACRSGAR